MLIPELAPYIKDNNQCKSHGKDMYIQMMEYIAYDGAYDKDTNTFATTLMQQSIQTVGKWLGIADTVTV